MAIKKADLSDYSSEVTGSDKPLCIKQAKAAWTDREEFPGL
jgi:hypothetical protein